MKAVVGEEGVVIKGADGIAWYWFLQRTWRELEEGKIVFGVSKPDESWGWKATTGSERWFRVTYCLFIEQLKWKG